MPLARIEIEQIEARRWVAEVEVGGFAAKRQRVTGESYDDVMTAVMGAYDEMLGHGVKKSAAVEPAVEEVIPASSVQASAADATVLGSVPTGTLGQDVPVALFATPRAAVEPPGTSPARRGRPPRHG